MSVRATFRTLALGSALILAALSLSATHAYARPKHPDDDGIRCAYFNRETGAWEFYLPGDFIGVKDSDGNIHTLVCGVDGNWLRQGSGAGSGLQGSGGNVATP